MVKPKQRKDGRWRIQKYIGKINGKNIYYPIYGKTEKECNDNYLDFEYKRKNNLLKGNLSIYNIKNMNNLKNLNKDITFLEQFEEFMTQKVKAKQVSINTKDDYIGTVKKNLNNIVNLTNDKLNFDIFQSEFNNILDSKGANLVNRVFKIINPFLKKLANTRKIEYNYLSEIIIPKADTTKHAECDVKTLNKLLITLKNDTKYNYLYMIILIISVFGTRISETLAIDYIESFDRKNKVLIIKQQQTKEKGK